MRNVFAIFFFVAVIAHAGDLWVGKAIFGPEGIPELDLLFAFWGVYSDPATFTAQRVYVPPAQYILLAVK